MPRSLAIITFVGFYIGFAVLLVVAKRLVSPSVRSSEEADFLFSNAHPVLSRRRSSS